MNQSGWERRAAPSISGSFQEQPWKMGTEPEVRAEERPLAFRKRKGPKAALLWAESTFNGLPISWTEAMQRNFGKANGTGQEGEGRGGEEKLLLLFLA